MTSIADPRFAAPYDPDDVDDDTRMEEALEHIRVATHDLDDSLVLPIVRRGDLDTGKPIFITPGDDTGIEKAVSKALRWRGGAVYLGMNPLPASFIEDRASAWAHGGEADLAMTRCVTADIDLGTTKDQANQTDVGTLRYPVSIAEIQELLDQEMGFLGWPMSVVQSGGGVLATWSLSHISKSEMRRLDRVWIDRATKAGFAVDSGCLAKSTTMPRLAGSIHRKIVDGEKTAPRIVRLLDSGEEPSDRQAMLQVLDAEAPERKRKKHTRPTSVRGSEVLVDAGKRIMHRDERGYAGRNQALASATGLLMHHRSPATAFTVIARIAVDEGLSESEVIATITSIIRRDDSDLYDTDDMRDALEEALL